MVGEQLSGSCFIIKLMESMRYACIIRIGGEQKEIRKRTNNQENMEGECCHMYAKGRTHLYMDLSIILIHPPLT